MSTATQPSTGNKTPLDLAKRYDKAGNTTKAARFYFLAGEHAFATYKNEDAITHYSTALAFTPDAQVETRYKIMSALEQVYALTSQSEARSQNLENMAALADQLDNDQKRADVAARLALFKLDNGDHQDAISISRLAVRIANLAKAHAAEADLYVVWGRTLLRLADYDTALGKLQKANQIAQAYALTTAEADSLRYLGVISEEKGDYAEAKSLYKQALARYELLNDLRGNSNMLNNLGKAAYDQGEYTAALRYWDHAKPNYLAIGDKSGTCRLLINQSAICLDLGDYSRGNTYSTEALTLSREIDLKFGEALGLINLSLIHQLQGDQETAQAHANAALALAQQMGSKRLEGYAYQTLGRTLHGRWST
jgi:tetratricopeptide (TPR) repeat protein